MTREEFIEKVDDAYSEEYFKRRDWTAAMGVAIDIVLEEAARVASIASLGCSQDAADRIQRAIRELKGE